MKPREKLILEAGRDERILRCSHKPGRYKSYYVTFPKAFIKFLNWYDGDLLEVVLDKENKQIIVRRKEKCADGQQA